MCLFFKGTSIIVTINVYFPLSSTFGRNLWVHIRIPVCLQSSQPPTGWDYDLCGFCAHRHAGHTCDVDEPGTQFEYLDLALADFQPVVWICQIKA